MHYVTVIYEYILMCNWEINYISIWLALYIFAIFCERMDNMKCVMFVDLCSYTLFHALYDPYT